MQRTHTQQQVFFTKLKVPQFCQKEISRKMNNQPTTTRIHTHKTKQTKTITVKQGTCLLCFRSRSQEQVGKDRKPLTDIHKQKENEKVWKSR